ncbi:hypothetical protein [Methylomonas rivi]|uniref:Uncharacterized protein n=1 Tax=Methylomonas rivi TaxID=2952226 RepID=A0ABT1U4S9_9GAMM|nr:hypothetical protein [Methylomonas sp. WSC-6]MCQ8128434.1 hypothetical protein [Methylomonas sp. WSC-6]
MSIAETIYQHVKFLPQAKALEVLQFVGDFWNPNPIQQSKPVPTRLCRVFCKACRSVNVATRK